MTEPKPIYEVEPSDISVSHAIEEVLKKAVADNSVYWQNVVAQERKKASDNLRLAAERATMIQELKDQLTEANEEIERLKGIIRIAENFVQEWSRETIRVCCDSKPGEEHEMDCPFYKWEGG